jgi:hypothetical protein
MTASTLAKSDPIRIQNQTTSIPVEPYTSFKPFAHKSFPPASTKVQEAPYKDPKYRQIGFETASDLSNKMATKLLIDIVNLAIETLTPADDNVELRLSRDDRSPSEISTASTKHPDSPLLKPKFEEKAPAPLYDFGREMIENAFERDLEDFAPLHSPAPPPSLTPLELSLEGQFVQACNTVDKILGLAKEGRMTLLDFKIDIREEHSSYVSLFHRVAHQFYYHSEEKYRACIELEKTCKMKWQTALEIQENLDKHVKILKVLTYHCRSMKQLPDQGWKRELILDDLHKLYTVKVKLQHLEPDFFKKCKMCYPFIFLYAYLPDSESEEAFNAIVNDLTDTLTAWKDDQGSESYIGDKIFEFSDSLSNLYSLSKCFSLKDEQKSKFDICEAKVRNLEQKHTLARLALIREREEANESRKKPLTSAHSLLEDFWGLTW